MKRQTTYRWNEINKKGNVKVIIHIFFYIFYVSLTQYYIFGQGGGKLLADKLEIPFLGEVPLEPALRVGGDQGTPIVVSDPTSKAAVAINEIAKAIIETKVVQNA